MEEKRRRTIVNDKNRVYYSETRKETKRQNPQNRKQRHKAAKKASRKVKIALALGVLGVGSLALASRNNEVKGITDGKEKVIIEVNEADKQENKKTTAQEYRESIANAAKTIETENEIDNLKTQSEIEAWMNNIYVEEYEKITGDESIDTSQIKIFDGSTDYIYVTSENELVSHGDHPYETEKQLKDDGKEFKTESMDNKQIYKVSINGKVLDSAMYLKNENNERQLKKVIVGNYYDETKNSQSVLEELGDIIPEAYKLKDLMGKLEQEPNSEYIKGLISTSKDKLNTLVENYQNKNQDSKQIKEMKQEDEGR